MEYSQATQNLIDKLCRIAERKDFKLEKKKAQELILKTYDLFDLPRPKKVIWHTDIDKKFIESACSACSASRASACSASSASSASACSAYSAYSASSASACSASRAYSAYIAYGDIFSNYSASIDVDFDWSVLVYEYLQYATDGNEYDKKYMTYSELLIEAKELGVGYFCDYKDVLHLVPCPIISCDELGRYHSTEKPAIYWKDGEELYYINGVSFDKKLWEKVTKDKLTPQEVFALENTEQRRIAYELMDKKKMLDLKNYEVLDEVRGDRRGYPMKIISFNVNGFDEPFLYLNCFCPTTGREYFIQTKYKECWSAKNSSFGLENVEWVNEW